MPGVVRRLTASAGPFPNLRNGTPEGLETLQTIARRAGVSPRALRRWQHLLPTPDWVTGRGRSVWMASTIDRWFEGAPLAHCDLCGARPLSLAIHRGQRHPEVEKMSALQDP